MSSETGGGRSGGAQESAQRLGEAFEEIAKAWTGRATAPETHGECPDPVRLAMAASKLSDSTLLNKLVSFTAGLNERELKDLQVLLIPAVLAADAAAARPIKPKHGSPAEFLRELDVRLARGDIGVGQGGQAAITPTITITTITTTIASHPVITCNAALA